MARQRKYAYAEGTPETCVRRMAIKGLPTQLVATTPTGGGMVKVMAESIITVPDYQAQAWRSAHAQAKTPQQIMAEATGFSLAFVLERWPAELLRLGALRPGTITVTEADFDALEAVVDTLDYSRKDDTGNCWYCSAEGNPQAIGEHAATCAWRLANALMFRIGDVISGYPEGHTVIKDGPEFRCINCGGPAWSREAADTLFKSHHQPAFMGGWTGEMEAAYRRATAVARFSEPGTVTADDMVDDGGFLVVCPACHNQAEQIAAAVRDVARGTFVCKGCGGSAVLDTAHDVGPACADCGLYIGTVPERDTQDGIEVATASEPELYTSNKTFMGGLLSAFFGPQDDDDDVPF